VDEPRFEGDSPNPPQHPVRRRTAARIWWAVAIAVGPAPLVALATSPREPRPDRAGVLLGFCLAIAALGWIVPRGAIAEARRRGASGARDATASNATLAALTLGFAGVFASAFALWSTRSPLLLLPWVTCALLLVRWYPTAARWERLEGRGPRSRMVRG
jgi:hypothetical protein